MSRRARCAELLYSHNCIVKGWCCILAKPVDKSSIRKTTNVILEEEAI
jgi:hypothetical protein